MVLDLDVSLNFEFGLPGADQKHCFPVKEKKGTQKRGHDVVMMMMMMVMIDLAHEFF